MRIFAAALATETNTFAPWPTGEADFRGDPLRREGGDLERQTTDALVVRCFRDLARGDGHDFVAGIVTSAQPSGPVVQPVYERLRDAILDDLRRQGPFDVVLLFLHGAMVATECDDCEGDILERVRQLVGPKPAIGVELDPHCHVTPAMLAHSDAIILMKEYPHTDFIERARELYAICVGKIEGRCRPVQALFDCRMVGFYPTTQRPMSDLVEQARAMEREPAILSASLVHGFPWGDTPETGSKALVIADGDNQLAQDAARRLGLAFYARRRALLPQMPEIEEALALARQTPGCVVLADTADNAGGGAPSDHVGFLRAMLQAGVERAAFGAVWDPVAVSFCAAAGPGGRIDLRLGGKAGPMSGDPLDITCTVRAIVEDHSQTAFGTARAALGRSAWIAVAGIDVVVSSVRTQIFSPDAFTGLGIAVAGKRLVVVKSSHHFHAGFAPIADRIIPVATPGAIQMNFAQLPYRRKRDLDFFPRVPDPLGADTSPEGAA